MIAIDPGPTESAFVVFDGKRIWKSGKVPNAELLSELGRTNIDDLCVCERIRSYGMPAGAELFETCEWTGRFWQAWVSRLGCEWRFLERKDVKLQLCRTSRAKDANVRQALIDRFGGKEKAIGTKKAPGPLHGIKADVWAALAVAVTWQETKHIREVNANA